MKVYENRVVAFIDVLGFRGLINNSQEIDQSTGELTQQAREELARILAVTNFLKGEEIGAGFQQEKTLAKINDRRVISFSDSIAISYPVKKLTSIIDDIIDIQTYISSFGILLRGGIAMGNLYHDNDDKIMFGSAFNDAYELESKISKHPRIIISEEILDSLEQDQDEEWMITRLISSDDGFYHLHMLHPDSGINTADKTTKQLSIDAIEKRISVVLATTKQVDVKTKMYWLKNYIEQAKDKFGYK